MARKKKDLNSIISFRLSNNMNDKTLNIVNNCFAQQQITDLLNVAVETYSLLLTGADVLTYFRNNYIKYKDVSVTTKAKKKSDTVSFRLKNVSPETVGIINNYLQKNELTSYINTSLELYRVLTEAAKATLKDNKKEEIKEKDLTGNSLLSLQFLQNIQR